MKHGAHNCLTFDSYAAAGKNPALLGSVSGPSHRPRRRMTDRQRQTDSTDTEPTYSGLSKRLWELDPDADAEDFAEAVAGEADQT